MPFGDPFPRHVGGGDSIRTQILADLLDALDPGWDPSNETASYAEASVVALLVEQIWRVNRRSTNRLQPLRMLDTLHTWEEACKIQPLATDTPHARRKALAARFLSVSGNTLADLTDVVTQLGNDSFLGFETVSSPYAYLPGANPGPPGFEYASSRATITVRLGASGNPGFDLFDLIRRVREALNRIAPVWMTFQIGRDDGGFVVDRGIVGVTLV